MSVACLLASPPAKGLFQRAIIQSGGADHMLQPDQARRIAQVFAQAAGDLRACLEGELKGIIAAQRPCNRETVDRGLHEERPVIQPGLTLVPVFGDDVLPEHPLLALQAGASAEIPLIIGTNAHEWELFYHLPQIIGMDALPTESYPSFLPGRGEALLAGYRERMPGASTDDILCAYESDLMFGMPTIRILEARQAASASSWSYRLNWHCPSMPALKSCHVMDIPFVFGGTGTPAGMFFTGGGEAAARLSADVRSAWASFARGEAPQAPGFPFWPSYETTERATLNIASETEVIKDPEPARRLAWEAQL